MGRPPKQRKLRPNAAPGIGAEGSTLQKDRIVEQVAFEMAEGKWRPFKSVRELAAKLGVSLSQAQKYCAEATRLLRLSWGQDEAKVAVLERISHIGRDALERTEEALDATGGIHTLRKPDHRTALAAAKHLADCLGLSGSNSEVVVRYQQMSDSELLREVQRFAQLQQGNQDGIIEISGEEVPEFTDDPERDDDQAALDKLKPAHPNPGR